MVAPDPKVIRARLRESDDLDILTGRLKAAAMVLFVVFIMLGDLWLLLFFLLMLIGKAHLTIT